MKKKWGMGTCMGVGNGWKRLCMKRNGAWRRAWGRVTLRKRLSKVQGKNETSERAWVWEVVVNRLCIAHEKEVGHENAHGRG